MVFSIVFFVLAFVISFLFCLFFISFSKKHGFYDEVNARKIHTGNVSRFGGLAMSFAFVISSVVFFFFHKSDIGFFLPIICGGIVLFVCGGVDDIKNLRARIKLLFQIIAALCVALSNFYFKEIFGFVLPAWLGRVLTFLWILFLVNAYNLIDGMDWLCGGISFINIFTYFLFFSFKGWNESSYILIACGCLLGFLFWNKPVAKLFMGDSGSLVLGYFVGVIPLLRSSDVPFEFNKILSSMLLSSIPCIDVIAAIIRRIREHRGIFSPDRGHLHHKLLNIGFSKRAILTLLLGLQFMICLVFLATAIAGRKTGAALMGSSLAFVSVLFIVLHYANRAVNQKMKGLLPDVGE